MSSFQKGFAPIVLVVLLLLGIAAGTLLVKNGVNFLPKAQQTQVESRPINPGRSTDPICPDNGSVTARYCKIPKGWTCQWNPINHGCTPGTDWGRVECPTGYHRGKDWGQDDKCFGTLCNYPDFTELRSDGRCYNPNDCTSRQLQSCVNAGVTGECKRKSDTVFYCFYSPGSTECVQHHRDQCEKDGNKECYIKKDGFWGCQEKTVAPPAAAPAAPPAAPGDCTIVQLGACVAVGVTSGKCIKTDTSFFCLYPPGTTECSKTHKNTCKVDNNKECYIESGGYWGCKEKTVAPPAPAAPGAPAPAAPAPAAAATNLCQGQCEVGTTCIEISNLPFCLDKNGSKCSGGKLFKLANNTNEWSNIECGPAKGDCVWNSEDQSYMCKQALSNELTVCQKGIQNEKKTVAQVCPDNKSFCNDGKTLVAKSGGVCSPSGIGKKEWDSNGCVYAFTPTDCPTKFTNGKCVDDDGPDGSKPAQCVAGTDSRPAAQAIVPAEAPGGTSPTACTNTKLCNYSEAADKCFSGVCGAGKENDCGFNRNCIADPAGLCTKPVDCKTAGTSGYSSSSGTGTNPATSTTCGVDDKGLQIPCYKIGVFDETTLQATIADAKIASANYALYRKIIDDLQKFVDTSQAAAKTAAAQKQADACINNTAI